MNLKSKNFFKLHPLFDFNNHKKLFAIALPMVISNIASPLLGLVDTAIIGHLPHSIYLSAVALGATVIGIVYLLAIFLRMATTGLMAQALGEENINKQRHVFLDGAIFASVLALFTLLLSPILLKVIWHFIAADLVLKQLVNSYLMIRFFGAPAAFMQLVILGVLLGLQRAKQAMILVVLANIINLAGNLILIIGFKLHVYGAASSTVIAEWAACLLGLYFVHQAIGLPKSAFKRGNFSLTRLKKLFGLNTDIFIRSLFLHACMAMMTFWASYQGQIFVAANAVLLQFLTLISLGLDGIAYAAEALIGRSKGAKQPEKAKVWFLLCLFWSLLLALVYAIIFAFGGGWIIRLITDLPEVVETAQQYLGWLILMPLVAHWAYLFDGVFIGLAASREMRNTMAFAALVCYLPAWWLTLDWGNHGLWFALVCFSLGRGMAQAYVFYKKQMLDFPLNLRV